MANGSFSNYVKGSNESNYFGLYCEYTYDQSVSGNYTNVTVDVWIRYYSLSCIAKSGTITVNGTSKSFTSPAINNYPGGGGKTKLGSQTIKVDHNSDGTKKDVAISVKWNCAVTYSSTYYASLSASKTVDLPTIPRASTITSASNITLGNKCSIKWTPASSSFKYKIKFALGDWYYTTGYISPSTTSAYTYTGYTISGTTEKNSTTIYKELPTKTSGTMTATLTTYNSSGTQIGSSSSKTFTVSIPSDITPTLGTISLNPVNITTADGTSKNILIKEKNKITVSVSGCGPGDGSSIKSYTFAVLSGSTVLATTTTPSTSASFGPFSKTGSLKFRVTVTDNRNRSVNNIGSEPTWTCYDYEAPYFKSFSAYRVGSSSSTAANSSGTYVRCEYSLAYSSVNSTNNVDVTIFYKKNTSSEWSPSAALTDSTSTSGNKTLSSIDAASTYTVYAQITDNYSGNSSSTKITVFGAERILNITKDGTGVAIGKMAENNNLFECRWPAKFDDDVTIPDNGGPIINGYSVGTLGPGTITLTDGDDLDSYTTPGSYRSTSAEISGSLLNSPWTSSGFKLIVESIANIGYLRQIVVPRTSSCKYYMRYYNSSSWGNWKAFESSDAIETAISKIDLSSVDNLTIGANQYYTSSSQFGINMNNSDIINANGIYFRDASDSAGESINFYRSDTTWDTLYAADGKLKFHPNRGASATLGGYTIYNNSNFRRGTCTLSSSEDTTVSFSSALGGTPTVMLTPLTDSAGVIPGKVKSTSTTGFTAIIGGSAVSSAKFAYLAIYY